jgi:hypothetical protein
MPGLEVFWFVRTLVGHRNAETSKLFKVHRLPQFKEKG